VQDTTLTASFLKALLGDLSHITKAPCTAALSF
jgi:hypothetical protein